MARKLRFSKEDVQRVVSESTSYAESIEKIGYADRNSGGAYKMLRRHILEYGIDISHFTKKRNKIIEKKCPKCGNNFKTSGKRQKTFCSKSCANGSRPRKYKVDGKSAYVHICWENHEKKCIICGEDLIVEVHHYDGDHGNNDPRNLIPLCPTHHKYAHSPKSGHDLIIKECVDDFIKTI